MNRTGFIPPMTASVSFSYSDRSRESQGALNEEVQFFRDICGWSDERIENYLGLAPQTLMQRKTRATRKERMSITDQINEILAGVLSPDGVDAWWGMKIPSLAGHTPREMLKQGETVALLELAKGYLNESFS